MRFATKPRDLVLEYGVGPGRPWRGRGPFRTPVAPVAGILVCFSIT